MRTHKFCPYEKHFSYDSLGRVLKVHHAGLPPPSLSSSSFTVPIKGELDPRFCIQPIFSLCFSPVVLSRFLRCR